MKKEIKYISPLVEVIELELEGSVLLGSADVGVNGWEDEEL